MCCPSLQNLCTINAYFSPIHQTFTISFGQIETRNVNFQLVLMENLQNDCFQKTTPKHKDKLQTYSQLSRLILGGIDAVMMYNMNMYVSYIEVPSKFVLLLLWISPEYIITSAPCH